MVKKIIFCTLQQAGANIWSMGYKNSNIQIGLRAFVCAEKYTEQSTHCALPLQVISPLFTEFVSSLRHVKKICILVRRVHKSNTQSEDNTSWRKEVFTSYSDVQSRLGSIGVEQRKSIKQTMDTSIGIQSINQKPTSPSAVL